MLLTLRSVRQKGLTLTVLCLCRFMNVPRSTMEEELKAQEKELSDDITSLNKKVQFISFHLPVLSQQFVVQVPRETVQRCSISIARYRGFISEFIAAAAHPSPIVPSCTKPTINCLCQNFCAAWKYAIVSLTLLVARAPDWKIHPLNGLQCIAIVCEGHLFILLQKVRFHDQRAIASASTCISRGLYLFLCHFVTDSSPSFHSVLVTKSSYYRI